MIRRWALLAVLLLATPALAQNPGIVYSGASPAANDCVKFINRTLVTTTGAACSTGTSFANPTASVGLTAVNGVATTAMRSDGAPALDQTAAFAFSNLSNTIATANGALSSGAGPGFKANGTWITGGTGTTTKPYILVEPSAATSTAWSTSGTGIGINSASGFVGNLLDLRLNNANAFKVTATGVVTANGSIADGGGSSLNGAGALVLSANSGFIQGISAGGNSLMSWPNAATWQLGLPNAASPVAQTLQAQGSRAGTDTNVGGAGLTITPGNGTGIGTRSVLTLQSPIVVASGTGAQTQTTGWRIDGGTGVSTGYTVATLPATPLAGARAHVTDQLTTCAGVGAALTGGGAVTCPAFYNGTAWVGG